MGDDEQHVLVIEDEAGLIDLFEIWLAERYRVTTATTGEAAEAAIDETVDAVILDWRLPDRTGGDLVDTFADRGFSPAIAVVTGAEPDADGMDESVDLILQKPIDRETLLGAIEKLLGTN